MLKRHAQCTYAHAYICTCIHTVRNKLFKKTKVFQHICISNVGSVITAKFVCEHTTVTYFTLQCTMYDKNHERQIDNNICLQFK